MFEDKFIDLRDYQLNESEDTVREFGNAKHLTIHDAEYDPLAYYEGNKLEKYEKEKAEYLELLKQKSSSSDAYKTYVKSTLNSIKKRNFQHYFQILIKLTIDYGIICYLSFFVISTYQKR